MHNRANGRRTITNTTRQLPIMPSNQPNPNGIPRIPNSITVYTICVSRGRVVVSGGEGGRGGGQRRQRERRGILEKREGLRLDRGGGARDLRCGVAREGYWGQGCLRVVQFRRTLSVHEGRRVAEERRRLGRQLGEPGAGGLGVVAHLGGDLRAEVGLALRCC